MRYAWREMSLEKIINSWKTLNLQKKGTSFSEGTSETTLEKKDATPEKWLRKKEKQKTKETLKN